MARIRGWHKSDVKVTLGKRGLTFSCLDKTCDLPESTASAAPRKLLPSAGGASRHAGPPAAPAVAQAP